MRLVRKNIYKKPMIIVLEDIYDSVISTSGSGGTQTDGEGETPTDGTGTVEPEVEDETKFLSIVSMDSDW